MRTINLNQAILLSVTLLLAGAVVADDSADLDKQNNPEVEESFMQRWFGWGRRAENPQERQVEKQKDKVKKAEPDQDKLDKKKQAGPHLAFSDAERSSILDYYRSDNAQRGDSQNKRHKKKKLPPGLQKKLERGGELPPGWQTKVSRGEVLDAELLSHAYPLPDDLTSSLPALQDGTEMHRIGDKIVRVMQGNGTVVDVVDLAGIVLNR